MNRHDLLRRVHLGLARGASPEELCRRFRIRRECWVALVDELSRGPEPDGLYDEEPFPPTCACENTGILCGDFLEEAHRVVELRPEARWEIDQVHTSAEDLARRAAFLADAGDVRGKDLLFVGDDDFCSVLLATVASPRRVVVVDIDPRILERIASAAAARGATVETVEYDLTRYVDEEIPVALAGAFDVFVTDPPYSEAGMALFCAFGLAGLHGHPGASAYVAVPWLAREEWSDELLFKVQRWFVEQGFMLTDVKRAFHTYLHLDQVSSTMVRAESVAGSHDPRRLLADWQRLKLYSSRRWTLEDQE